MSVPLINACSSSSEDTVAQLNALQIPVVQPTATANNANQTQLTQLYHSNQQDISTLTATLKSKYLQDADRQDMFDVHSQSSRVYRSLSTLEQAGLMNEQYFKQHNTQGLQQLNSALTPFIQPG